MCANALQGLKTLNLKNSSVFIRFAFLFLLFTFLSGCQTQQTKPVIETPQVKPIVKTEVAIKPIVKPKPKKRVRPLPPNSLQKSSSFIFGKVYADHANSFYCRCNFDENLSTTPESCGIYNKELPNAHRSTRIELESLIPIHWLKSTSKLAANDLQNLFPVNGQLRGNRRATPFIETAPEHTKEYGLCKVIDSTKGRQPPARIQGDIARIYFYMKFFYGIKGQPQDEVLLKRWAQEDPVDAWEKKRNARIARIQKVGNPYVEWKKIR